MECECQGECGYGPNLVVDGNIKNNVKGEDAVLSALGISDDNE
jgi:NADH:ubiquinone oxidoreductase subunit E